jgi:hypothetical protein
MWGILHRHVNVLMAFTANMNHHAAATAPNTVAATIV